jgi:4-amino-4-deoxy-L-arabinose transferase-like glycosyltransferase
LAVHVAFVLIVGNARLEADGAEYVAVARRLAGGEGLTTAGGKLYVHSHPPLYPVFLAGVFKLGGDLTSARLAQAALAVVTLAFAFAAANEALGRKAAVAALGLGALYLPAAYYDTQILTETLFALPLAAGFYCLVRAWRAGGAAQIVAFAAAGVSFGAAALIRTVALPAALALGAYLLLAGGAWRRRLARTTSFVLGALLVLACWSGYVYARTGRIVVVDTSGPAIFYIGNNERTPFHHAWRALDDPASSAPLREALQPEVDGFALAASYRRAAVRYVVSHPLEAGARLPGKILDFLEPERLFAGSFVAGRVPDLAPGLAAPLIAAEVAADAALLLLWGWGLAAMPRSRFADMLRVLVVAVVVVHGLTYAYPRYHVPLVLVGLGAAGYVAAEGLPALRRRPWPRRQVAAAAAVALALLISWARMVLLYVLRG